MPLTLNTFDADGHITEPPDLWERYIDPKFRDDCPKIIIGDDGQEELRIDRNISYKHQVTPLRPSIATGSNFGMQDGSTSWGKNYLEGEKGGFDPHERIKWLDKEGFDATILFPTTSLSLLEKFADKDKAIAAADAYNRYLADFCSNYPERLYGAVLMSLTSVEASVKQIKLGVMAGMKAAVVSPAPIDGKPLHHPSFYPVWEALQESEMALAVHGSAGGNNLGQDRFGKVGQHLEGSYAALHSFVHPAEMMAAYTSFILCGICEKYPRLRIAFVEAGGAWVPGYIDRMDRHYIDVGANDLEISNLPSEIYQRQCYTSFEPVEKSIKVLAEYLGPNKFMVSSDYPHSDGFPNTLKLIKNMGLDEEIEKQLCITGAKEWLAIK